MATTVDRKRTSSEQPKMKKVVGAKRLPVRSDKMAAKPATPTAVGKLRSRLGLTQAEFARLVPVSVRTLATLEGGSPPTEAVSRRLVELERLIGALAEVIKSNSLRKWLLTPAQAFDGLKPLEVIERGEGDRLWQMVYFLRSGVPF